MKFNYQAFKAIYLHEMDRFKRTLGQSLLSPVLSTSLYSIFFYIPWLSPSVRPYRLDETDRSALSGSPYLKNQKYDFSDFYDFWLLLEVWCSCVPRQFGEFPDFYFLRNTHFGRERPILKSPAPPMEGIIYVWFIHMHMNRNPAPRCGGLIEFNN